MRAKSARRAMLRNIPRCAQTPLYRAHGWLAERRFTAGSSKLDDAALALVRWCLDWFHDAEMGDDLDRLEALCAEHERLVVKVQRVWSRRSGPRGASFR